MSSSATPAEKEIRILIADDHPVVREGLTAILELESDLKVVGQAHDGEEACRLYEQLSPDILILDLRMPKKPLRCFVWVVLRLGDGWDGQREFAGPVIGGGSEVDEVLESSSHSLC